MIQGLSLQDAIFNWLTIQIVVDHNENDVAAQKTCHELLQVLKTDHQIKEINYVKKDEMYIVHYLQENEKGEKQYPIELAESLLTSIADKTFYVPGLD